MGRYPDKPIRRTMALCRQYGNTAFEPTIFSFQFPVFPALLDIFPINNFAFMGFDPGQGIHGPKNAKISKTGLQHSLLPAKNMKQVGLLKTLVNHLEELVSFQDSTPVRSHI